MPSKASRKGVFLFTSSFSSGSGHKRNPYDGDDGDDDDGDDGDDDDGDDDD